ncbi:hypothetical protein GB937_006116 [Aspergillus fischeri]|nr:hypothetical protein GB937_006116 [Aspergillus fischeri]
MRVPGKREKMVGLMDEKEKAQMEQLVARKLEKMKDENRDFGATEEKANADEPDEANKMENSRVKEEKR